MIINQELQLSINRLGERCAPWLKIHLVGPPTLAQITGAVDKIVYDDGIEEQVMLLIRFYFTPILTTKWSNNLAHQ